MYELLAEKPLVLSLMIAAVVAVLVTLWLKDGRRLSLAAAVACGLLIPAAWWLADRLVTERERIEEIIDDVAAAIQANDHDAAVRFLASDDLKARAENELSRYRFDTARVNRLRRIDLFDDSFPPEAEVELTVTVEVSERSGPVKNVRVPRKLILRFLKVGKHPGHGGKDWRVSDYAHYPVVGRVDNYSSDFSQP